MGTIAALRADVLRRLGDTEEAVWSGAEVELHLDTAYRLLANAHVFPDWRYLESQPAAFSYTAAFELKDGWVVFNSGRASFTHEDERDYLTGGSGSVGPAWSTSPFEATDGWVAAAGASTAIPATADLPATVLDVERALWDGRVIDALLPKDLQHDDSRYQVTAGEVYGYLWRQDGVRTMRLVRVPAAQGSSYTVTGSWGALRSPADLGTSSVTGSWGLPRQIPGQHPLGPNGFGAPRRPYQDGTNVRVEHWRNGRDWTDGVSTCELPDRYEKYLRDYALAKCYGRVGPGQDLALAAVFAQRWDRNVTRVTARMARFAQTRTGILGGQRPISRRGVPRPSRPWAFGSQTR